jgi:hypothetical protein
VNEPEAARLGPPSFLCPPHPVDDWVTVGGATDDQLADLLHALRRYVAEAPDGMWGLDVLEAARAVTAAVSIHLQETGDA